MIPISTIFIGLNGLIALILSCIVAMGFAPPSANERTRTRIWHGESKEDVIMQPDPLTHPNVVAATVEKLAVKILPDKVEDYAVLQRKEGIILTIARIAHAWGLIKTYGPSPGRAIGFYLTWFVYIVGSLACIYYGIKGVT
jgi:uncharacterized protein